MTKTAEEFVRESCHITDDTVISNISDAIGAAEAFAAQEVEAFKDKLRTAIMYADDDGSSRYREGMKSVLDLIDIVK